MNGFEIQCLPGAGLPTMDVRAEGGLAYPNEDWFFEAIGAGRSDSGVRVTPSTALSHGPVWQAVNILAGDVGQLPLRVMRQRGRDRDKFPEHPVDWLLNSEPNATQTPSKWKETMMSWALLWGNACCVIERDSSGRPTGLLPLLPDRTGPRSVDYQANSGDRFRFIVIESWIDNELVPFLYEDIFHISGLATDGFWGISAVDICKNVIGSGMASQKHGNKLFNNGAMPSGVLEHPGKLGPEARTNLRKEWYDIHGGINNAGKIAVLWEDMKFHSISMSSRDAQWIEDKEFDREMTASLFQLPAFKLNALRHSSVRANLEEQNRDYFNTSLSRHLNKFSEEGNRKLFSTVERRPSPRRGSVYLRWMPEAFLRGDTKSRFESYNLAITGRFMSPNEVRAKEDMNPYDGGDEFLNPAIEKSSGNEEKQLDQKSMARSLVGVQVQAMLETEAKTLEKAVGTKPARNFCQWASNYYDSYTKMAQNFLETPGRIAFEAGFEDASWQNATQAHASRSLAAVLELAEQVTKPGLADVINQRAREVRGMRDSLTNSILGEDNA